MPRQLRWRSDAGHATFRLTATAKAKLKAAFKKMQDLDDPDDAVDEPGETGEQTRESGNEN